MSVDTAPLAKWTVRSLTLVCSKGPTASAKGFVSGFFVRPSAAGVGDNVNCSDGFVDTPVSVLPSNRGKVRIVKTKRKKGVTKGELSFRSGPSRV